MAQSFKILSVFGIDIELHLFFVIFILAFFLISPAFGLLLILVFFFVTMHELCHSLVALRNGIRVRKIILLPIGGMAVIDESSIKPWTEIKMSIAGPLFNFALAALILAVSSFFNWPIFEWTNELLAGNPVALPQLLVVYSFLANVVLGAFNLFLPAFPLDGGRIFRAILALKLDYLTATNIAKTVSLVIAGGMFFLGFLYTDMWIMVIAFFIGFGAIAEYKGTVLHATLRRIKIQSLVNSNFIIVDENEPVSGVVKRMFAGKNFAALVENKEIKLIDLRAISKHPQEEWKILRAKDVAQSVKPVGLRSSPEKVLRFMMQNNVSMLPVISKGQLLGVVYISDIEKMVAAYETLKKI